MDNQIVVDNFISSAANMVVVLKEENKISRFKTNHGEFIAKMRAGDFDGFLKGATLKNLTKGLESWVSRDMSHIAKASGSLVAAYESNKEGFVAFQVSIMRNKLLTLGNNTEYIPTEAETKALDHALEAYATKCIPYVMNQCADKLAIAIPNAKKRKETLGKQLEEVKVAEADEVRRLAEADA